MRGPAASAVAVAAALFGATAAPAHAAVEVGQARVVVSVPAGRAVIYRHPFRLTVTDARGNVLLAEVPNEGQAPLVTPPTVAPTPGGGSTSPPPALYAPLAFTVGSEADAQQPAGLWEGDLLVGLRAGVQYSARDVVGATAAGSGVALDVTTSDPGGRHLAVTVGPDAGGRALRVSVRPTPADGVAVMTDAFASGADEAFHGFGGRHNAIDQHGNAFYSFIEQENVGAGPFQPVADAIPGGGGTTYHFPNGPTAAYYVAPQFISSRPYGFWLDRPEIARFRLDSDRADAWSVDVAAPGLDYVVAPGAAPGAIHALTGVTGRQRVPPDWGLGPMMDRLSTPFTETAASFEQKVRDDLANIDRYHLPLKAYRIEGWALLSPETVRSLIADFHRRGIHVLLYFRSFASADTGGTEQPDVFAQALAGGYFATTATGSPYLFVANFGSAAGVIDFTNPAAVRWWQGRLRSALDLGADGFMQDFGEQVQLDMHFADGETGATMHNRYPTVYHRATRALIDAYEREHPGRRIWFFTRTGYPDRPGSAAYENANFPGDETTDFSRSTGLASLATDLLNRGIAGAVGYGTDIGGYVDYHTPATTKELFLRWAEAAALTPVFRLHGSAGAGTHTPWSFDAETVAAYRDLSLLHERASALILALWREAAATGAPIARPLWLQYPGDRHAAAQDQQWLLGPDVLVAPVVAQGAATRAVYFPAGCWYDPQTGAAFNGPGAATVPAPLTKLPYYFHCGTDPFLEAAGVCRDRHGPRSRIDRRHSRVSRRRLDIRGRATDTGCRGPTARTSRRGVVRLVYVSVARDAGHGRCRFVTARGRLGPLRSCRRNRFFRTRGTTRWRLARPVHLPRGTYTVFSSALDAVGNGERARRRANVLRVRLR